MDNVPKFKEAQLTFVDGFQCLVDPHRSNKIWCKKEDVGFIYNMFFSSASAAGKSTREIKDSDWENLRNQKLFIWYQDEFTNPENYRGIPYMEGEIKPVLVENKAIIMFQY